MRTIFSTIFFLCIFAPAFGLDYEPFVRRYDFESREMMGWSSYPPIQDAAYEAPFIYPGTIVPGDSGVSLVKVIRPEYDAPQLTGVVKKLPMRLDNRGAIRFRYYIKSTVAPSWLGIDLPLADGGRVLARFPNPRTNAWVSAEYSLAEILRAAGRSPVDSLDITAFALTVRFERADPDMPIFFGFDDFEAAGSRPSRFVFEDPKTRTLDEWEAAIALRHYRAGESMRISGAFPNSFTDAAEMRIVRFDRPEILVETLKLVKIGVSWTINIPLSPSLYPPGLYTAEIAGFRRTERVAGGKVTFLVVDDSRLSGHPRLWFNRNETDGFIAKVKREKNAPYLTKLREEAKTARERQSPDLPYDLDTFPVVGWLKSFEPYRHRIATLPQAAFNNAVAWTVDNDPAAAEFARKILLSLCAWPTWTHPWMVERGHQIYLYQWYTAWNLALVYDLIHDRLTAAERRTVRAAFERNLLKPAYRTYVEMDQCTCNESNWIAAVAGGAITAACAVLGDEGDSNALEPYLTGCFYKLRAHVDVAFGGDSACLEGFGYASGTMWIYSAVLPVIERCLGVDLSGKIHRSYVEMFWAGDHRKKEYYTFGDARFGAPTSSSFPWLVEKYRDPELAWFLDLLPPEPNYVSYHTMLYDPSDVPRKEPELSGAKWFKKTGTVVFRSGNEPNPFVLTFRCGPFGNHQHLDQGTFLLADRGELLVTEQEYSDYYEDPIYQSHIIQPAGHNCLLVDHNPQSQRTGDHGDYASGMSDYARITAFAGGDNMAFALGDLSSVYLGNVKSLRRGVLWLRPRTVLLVDLLETRRGEASLDALFHGPGLPGVKTAGENAFTITSGSATLDGRVVYPSNPVLRVNPDPVKLAKFTNDPIVPLGRVTVTAETKAGKAASAVVLSTEPLMKQNAAFDGGTYLALEKARVLFNASGAETEKGGLLSDALITVADGDGSVLMAEGTACDIDGRAVFRSGIPVTVLKEGGMFHFSAAKPGIVSVDAGNARFILLDGVPVKGAKRDNSTGLTPVRIPAGQCTVEAREKR